MMKPAAANPHRPMQPSRSQFRRLIWLVCLIIALPLAGLAQTDIPTPLPPEAQAAINKGIVAAKVPDYLLSIRYFEEARKIAPAAPEVFFNLGLAESKIPGRELRAIAWFGAYLAAYPDAPNAAAVKEQIAVLDVRNQSNVLQLIKAVQDVASQMSVAGQHGDIGLSDVTKLWLDFGDMTAAQKAANLIQDKIYESHARYSIAIAQASKGDFTGAQKTSDLIQVALYKSRALIGIAEAQIEVGDLAGAKKTFASAVKSASLIDRGPQLGFMPPKIEKIHTQRYIAIAQAESGDIAGAQKTADLLKGTDHLKDVQAEIAKAKAKAGNTNAPSSTRQSTSDTKPPIQPVITVSDWLEKLDDDNKSNDCPLNTGPFLDMTGHLKETVPPSSFGAHSVFAPFHKTAKQFVSAQNVITGMLKQQAKQ